MTETPEDFQEFLLGWALLAGAGIVMQWWLAGGPDWALIIAYPTLAGFAMVLIIPPVTSVSQKNLPRGR